MNNKSFYLIFGCLIFVISIFTTSCSKEEKEVNSIPAADMAIYNKIQAFKNRMSHPLKTNPPMSIDSAKWYIETSFNCTYGDASYEFNYLNIDSVYIQVPVSNGFMNFETVTTTYDVLLDSIRAHYYGISGSSKQFIYARLEVLPGNLKTNTETILLTSAVAEDRVSLWSFNDTDWWKYGGSYMNSGGKCGAYTGFLDSDAAEEIQKKVHIRKAVPSGNYYYVNPVVLEATPPDFINPNATQPNICQCFLYLCIDNGWLPNVHICLAPYEMNFYLAGAERIIYNSAPIGLLPSGKSFVSIDMVGDEIFDIDTWYLHRANITYAVLVNNPNPPVDL